MRLDVCKQIILRQLFQRRQSLRPLQKGHFARMEKLLRLRDEFNLANAAAAKLHVSLEFTGANHFVLDAILHRADLVQRLRIDRARITKRLNGFQKFRGQPLVARHATRLDQHHPLPGLAPLRVIIFVALQRPAERSGIAFRTEPQVDAKQRAFRRHAGNFRNERFRQLCEKLVVGHRNLASRRRPDRGSNLPPGDVGGPRLKTRTFIAVDKQHVHIRTVVQFLPAEFPHAEHAEFRRLPLAVDILMRRLAEAFGQLAMAYSPDGFEADIRDIGKLARDLRHVAQARQITRRDAQHFALFEFTDAAERSRVIPGLEKLLQPSLDFAA